MTSRPASWSRAAWAAASTRCSGSARSYRPVSRLPALTAGFTTTSPEPGTGRQAAAPGSIHSVGTTGTPPSARRARYRLSVLPATTSAGLASRERPSGSAGTEAAHATNSSRRHE